MIASVAPSVSPSVAPAVHAVATAVAVHSNSFQNTLNNLASQVSQADQLLAAGVLATGIQYLANRFRNFKKFTNQLIGVAIPFLVAAPATIDGFKNLAYGSVIYCVAQVLYYTVEKVKDQVAASLAPAVEA